MSQLNTTTFEALLPDYLSAADKARLGRIRAGRLLFDGNWRQFLLGDGRTAHVFKALRNAQGRERPLLVTVNVLGLAAKKCADLLMLTAPTVTAGDGLDAQQAAIERINQASHVEAVLYEGALTACYEAEAWMQVMRFNGRTILANVPADRCFPVGDQQPDGSYAAVEKRWELTRGEGPSRRRYLRKEIHSAGLIVNELWAVTPRGQLDGRVELAGVYGLQAPPDQQETGVDEPLLDFVPNFTVGGRCVGDFDGIDELVDQFTAAVSQAAGVMAKHADPKLGIPEQLFDEDGRVKATDELFAFVSKEETPFYITWNANLEAGIKLIDHWLRWLLIICEMSPAILGLKEGAAPDAYKKLRLEAVNTLAKVARKKIFWHRFLIDQYRRAAKLDNASPGQRYDFEQVSIDWNDGIPLDEAERIDQLVSRRSAGLIDRQTAVEQLDGPAAAEQIVSRMAEEDSSRRQEAFNFSERIVNGNGE